MDNRRNYFFLIIAVIAFGLMLTGGTYAWLTLNTTNVGDNIISGDSTCFVIDYSGNFEGGLLFPSNTDKGGLMGTVTLGINRSCNVNAVADVKMIINTSVTSPMYNNKLRYSIYDSENSSLGSGIFSFDSDNYIIKLNTSSIKLKQEPATYYVYVWLKGTEVDNSYLNLPFSGSLKASATQVE